MVYCAHQGSEVLVQDGRFLQVDLSIKTSFCACSSHSKRKARKDLVMEAGIILYAFSTIVILKYVSYIPGIVHLY